MCRVCTQAGHRRSGAGINRSTTRGHTFRQLNGGFLASLPALLVVALHTTYPTLNKVIKEHANDEGHALLS
ncbi:lipase family protein [Mycobacterium lepromatosis]|uniref:lipase family protein n=1 Tax=Mycobacterium lepromatosis TaxID=480418 RepID=UPI000679E3D4|nr:lipase family protein [Mycobacterium lepromatosis]